MFLHEQDDAETILKQSYAELVISWIFFYSNGPYSVWKK